MRSRGVTDSDGMLDVALADVRRRCGTSLVTVSPVTLRAHPTPPKGGPTPRREARRRRKSWSDWTLSRSVSASDDLIDAIVARTEAKVDAIEGVESVGEDPGELVRRARAHVASLNDPATKRQTNAVRLLLRDARRFESGMAASAAGELALAARMLGVDSCDEGAPSARALELAEHVLSKVSVKVAREAMRERLGSAARASADVLAREIRDLARLLGYIRDQQSVPASGRLPAQALSAAPGPAPPPAGPFPPHAPPVLPVEVRTRRESTAA